MGARRGSTGGGAPCRGRRAAAGPLLLGALAALGALTGGTHAARRAPGRPAEPLAAGRAQLGRPLVVTGLLEAGRAAAAREAARVDPTEMAGVESFSYFVCVNATAASYTYSW